MQKYYYNDGVNRFGPFTMEELQAKNISAATPVWYDGLPNWTPAGELEELKSLFASAAPTAAEQMIETIQPVIEEIKAAEPVPVEKAAEVMTITESAVTVVKEEPAPPPPPAPEPVQITTTAATTTVAETVAAAPAPAAIKPARKKGSPILTWVLPLLVLGGTGYYVYQDMEKNKKTTTVVLDDMNKTEENGSTTTTTNPDDKNNSSVNNENNTTTTETNTSNESNTANVPPADTKEEKTEAATNVTPPVTDKGKTPTLAPPAKDPAELKKQQEKQKQAIADAKKKEEEKKKQAALKEEERKKQQAAKEMEMRNSWTRYVTIGSFTVTGDDRVDAFSIPVTNNFPVMADKITLRVDYLKKEKKNVGTETLVLNNIPGKSTQTVQAAGNKKAKTANVYIIGVTSRQLHFCYPVNNGNAADPYFCN